MRYALSNYAVCKMVFHIASEFITYLRTPTNFGKITFSCSVMLTEFGPGLSINSKKINDNHKY